MECGVRCEVFVAIPTTVDGRLGASINIYSYFSWCGNCWSIPSMYSSRVSPDRCGLPPSSTIRSGMDQRRQRHQEVDVANIGSGMNVSEVKHLRGKNEFVPKLHHCHASLTIIIGESSEPTKG